MDELQEQVTLAGQAVSPETDGPDPVDVLALSPSAAYERLAAPFRPIFARIAAGAVQRERDRVLPLEPIRWLTAAGFGAVRLTPEQGGAGATLPELFALLAELATADSNITQALRAHFAFVEDVLSMKPGPRRDRWARRIAGGETVGSAWTETGSAQVGTFATTVRRQGEGWLLQGEKYYTTGSIFADWIDVGASDEAGVYVSALVAASAPGVVVIDDWDGFGQILTGSGTSRFAAAPVAEDEVVVAETRFAYAPAFYQMVHLATLVGIARACARDVADEVRARRRAYSHGAAAVPAQDAQVLQVVGRVHGLAYAAWGATLIAAQALQRAYEGSGSAAAETANLAAELEVSAAQTVVTELVLEATQVLFDALGASATGRAKSLDRHWRNARTITSHNPRIYKDRVVGDYAVNRTSPPFQWRIGQATG